MLICSIGRLKGRGQRISLAGFWEEGTEVTTRHVTRHTAGSSSSPPFNHLNPRGESNVFFTWFSLTHSYHTALTDASHSLSNTRSFLVLFIDFPICGKSDLTCSNAKAAQSHLRTFFLHFRGLLWTPASSLSGLFVQLFVGLPKKQPSPNI